jgi:hypothetical protein
VINFGVCMNSNMIMVQLLDEIAELFYGVQRRNPLQGMFGDIFQVNFSTSMPYHSKHRLHRLNPIN